MTYRGYSIEQEPDGTYSLYSLANSMYDVHNGFKTIEAAKSFADHRYTDLESLCPDCGARFADHVVGGPGPYHPKR